MITVNAMGDACPIPVVKAKRAIEEQNGAALQMEVLVDNEIAVQNLTKMAEQKGYPVSSRQIGAQAFRVVMDVPASSSAPAPDPAPAPPSTAGGQIVVISSTQMGSGNEELGAALLKSFVYALSQLKTLPDSIIFYNSGVRNAIQGSPLLEDLRNLEQQGVTILSCGTCLNYYGLTEQLAVGSVTNMYDIAEREMRASGILRP
jgi:hypothetical protein